MCSLTQGKNFIQATKAFSSLQSPIVPSNTTERANSSHLLSSLSQVVAMSVTIAAR